MGRESKDLEHLLSTYIDLSESGRGEFEVAAEEAISAWFESRTAGLTPEQRNTLNARWRLLATLLHQQDAPPRPGQHFSSFVRLFLTPRAFRQLVLVTFAEMQAECAEEMANGCVWQARWVVIRGYAIIMWAFISALCPRFVRKLF